MWIKGARKPNPIIVIVGVASPSEGKRGEEEEAGKALEDTEECVHFPGDRRSSRVAVLTYLTSPVAATSLPLFSLSSPTNSALLLPIFHSSVRISLVSRFDHFSPRDVITYNRQNFRHISQLVSVSPKPPAT